MHGLEPCITFGALRPDAAIAQEVLIAVEPLAVQAAIVAEREAINQLDERRRAMELERQQAEYEVTLARRRYEAVDPDNRLVAAELEARWNVAMTRLHECEARLSARVPDKPPAPMGTELLRLGTDLERAWHSPTIDMRTKQRLVRALIEEIIVDVDDAPREVILTVHWRGGQHSELRVRKPGSGEHTRRACAQASAVVGEMAGRWSDADIAATLNRMGLTTGQGNTWSASRVVAYRRSAGIHGYASAVKDGRCLTMIEAARTLEVTCHVVRNLIRAGVLPARQVMPDAPWQIRATDLDRPEVRQALRSRARRGRPCRNSRDDRTLTIPGT